MADTVVNSGISNAGTSWRLFSTGNVEMTFVTGATTIINPGVLGLTLEEAIASFEGQLQALTPAVQITDQEYLDLIEDILGGLPTYSPDTDLSPDAGLRIGIALLPMFMTLSSKGLQNLTSLLGFFPIPVLNSLNQWVVGFQHVIRDDELPFYNSFPMSIPQAIQILLSQIANVFQPLLQNLIRVPLTQGQFDALLGSAIAMGPTRFANSGIPGRVNAGDFPAAAEIRECYNSTNGDYDPAKGFAANTQSMGIQQTTDTEGANTIADPSLANVVEGPASGSNAALHEPAPGMVDAINSAAQGSTSMSPEQAAAALYGFSHAESGLGNQVEASGSTAAGPYHYTQGTWLEYVKNYGNDVPGLSQYSAALKNNPTTALKSQVLDLRYDPVLSSKLTVAAIDRYYMPTLRNNGLEPTLGGLWNVHYLPGSIRSNYANQHNWGAVNTGWTYASRYYR